MENIYSAIQTTEELTSPEYLNMVRAFRNLYWHLQDAGLSNFGDDGKVFGFDGEFILQESAFFYSSREEYYKAAFFMGLLTKLRERIKAHSENIGKKSVAITTNKKYNLALPKNSSK